MNDGIHIFIENTARVQENFGFKQYNISFYKTLIRILEMLTPTPGFSSWGVTAAAFINLLVFCNSQF